MTAKGVAPFVQSAMEAQVSIVWIIIIGLVAGIIARFISPGPNNPSGFILTALLGIAGAFVSTFIGQATNLSAFRSMIGNEPEWQGITVSSLKKRLTASAAVFGLMVKRSPIGTIATSGAWISAIRPMSEKMSVSPMW